MPVRIVCQECNADQLYPFDEVVILHNTTWDTWTSSFLCKLCGVRSVGPVTQEGIIQATTAGVEIREWESPRLEEVEGRLPLTTVDLADFVSELYNPSKRCEE